MPEAEAPSQLEVVTADVFSQARIDTGNAVCSTAQERTDDASFVLRLQGLVEDYRDIVNNLPKKPITGHSNLTKEWLVGNFLFILTLHHVFSLWSPLVTFLRRMVTFLYVRTKQY